MITRETIESNLKLLEQLENEMLHALYNERVDDRLGSWIEPPWEMMTQYERTEIEHGESLAEFVKRVSNTDVEWDEDDCAFFSRKSIPNPKYESELAIWHSNVARVLGIQLRDVVKLSNEEINRQLEEMKLKIRYQYELANIRTTKTYLTDMLEKLA